MGKSTHRKNHKEKLAKYKSNKKIEQDSLKKKMIENYIKMQQDALANQQEHTSTEEVVGPEINIDDLNTVDDMIVIEPEVIDSELIDDFNIITDVEDFDNIIGIEEVEYEMVTEDNDSTGITENPDTNDNDNQ